MRHRGVVTALVAAMVATTLAGASLPVVSSAALAQRAEFPFGSEMTLDAAPMRGSKRVPVIEIGGNGEAQLDLYCKRATGQFSVANDSVIFIAGPVASANCPADRAQADDALLATLQAATGWRRQGDVVSFIGGPRPLRFYLQAN